MNNVLITIKKEIRSILRDRKTLVTLLIFPLFIPMMIFLYSYMYEDSSDSKNYLIGINYDVNSTESSLLEEANLDVKDFDSIDEMKNSYDNGEIFGYIDYSSDNNTYTIWNNIIRYKRIIMRIFFSKDMSQEEEDYFEYLTLGIKAIWTEEKLYFPLENGDFPAIMENQRISKIKLSNLSNEFKRNIKFLVNDIDSEIGDRVIKNIIKEL